MLLLALAASLLVSAGSPHHQPGAANAAAAGVADTTVTAGVGDAALAQPGAHEHHHLNDWAPTLSKRVRPAATTILLGILPARMAAPAVPVHRESAPVSVASVDELSASGVLRV